MLFRSSREEFELTPEGYAVARQGQHKVIISPVLNDAEGAVDLETPDGRRLRSTVLALALYNRATGQSLWLAEVSPDAEGRLVSPNEVQFADAFQGFACDLRYVYRRGDFRQEVLPREQVAPQPLAKADGKSRQDTERGACGPCEAFTQPSRVRQPRVLQ